VVEFRRTDAACDMCGVRSAVPLPGRDGVWRPFPVEYKRGKPKPHRADEVQLCAQALCLEEMMGVVIPEGALFYGEMRRRQCVAFDLDLRQVTEQTVAAVRGVLEKGETPPPVCTDGCTACSLRPACCPDRMSTEINAHAWIDHMISEELEDIR